MSRIVRIISRLNVGGPALHVTNLNQAIPNSILVYGSLAEGEGSMEYLLEDKHLKSIKLPLLGREISLKSDLSVLWDLIKIIRQEKPEIVHTHTAKAGFIGRIAAKLCGVPKIYHTFHGHVFHGYFGKFKTSIFILIERVLASFSTKIIAISPEQKKDLIAYGIADEEDIIVIPLGFDLDPFLQVEPQKHSGKIIAIVGRLVPIKNHYLFIKIARAFPDHEFWIVGDGELHEELQLIAPKNVKFKGFIKDMPSVYAEIDLLLLTSLNEGTPVAIIEALAAGVPVLATDVGGIKDVLAGITNAKVLPAEEKDFKLMLPFMLQQRVPAKERVLIHDRYSIKRLVSDLQKLYQEK